MEGTRRSLLRATLIVPIGSPLKARTLRHGPDPRCSVLDYAEPGFCWAVTSGHGHGDRESGESRAAAQTVAQCIRRGAREQEIGDADYVGIDIILIEEIFPEADGSCLIWAFGSSGAELAGRSQK